MKNHWILSGLVAAIALTGIFAARVSGHTASPHRTPTSASAASARQQMARMVAEAAARSAAQAAKSAVANDGIDSSNVTASAAVQMRTQQASDHR